MVIWAGVDHLFYKSFLTINGNFCFIYVFYGKMRDRSHLNVEMDVCAINGENRHLIAYIQTTNVQTTIKSTKGRNHENIRFSENRTHMETLFMCISRIYIR